MEVQDIFNSFAFEKEPLIHEFTEEHKPKILEIQNERRESILLQDHTERVDHLQDEVQKLQQELIQRENNRHIQEPPQNNNEETSLSDSDTEVDEIEPTDLVDIDQRVTVEVQDIDLEEVENIDINLELENKNMAQNCMDLLKYLPKFEGEVKTRIPQLNMLEHSKNT